MINHHKHHVVIVGGGIGGLLAALAAARRGFAVTVLERSQEFGEIGAGLQLAPNATRVLKRLGVLDDVLDIGVLPQRLVLADAVTAKELTSLDVSDFDRQYGGPYVVAHRGDVLSILLNACISEPSIELSTGKNVTQVDEPQPGKVTVTCADGSTFSGDVVVGADGLHSRVRTLIDDSEPIFSGYVAYRGAVPTETVAARSASRDVVAFLGKGLHFVQYPLRSGNLYNQVAVFRSERYFANEAEWGGPDELEQAFSATHERIRTALTSIERGASWPMYDREPLGSWTHGRTVLLGDAAHPMLQYLAQGACQAMQDGESLADALAEARDAGRDLADGFQGYEDRRLEPAGRTQRNARMWGDMWHSDGVTRVLMDAYLQERDPQDLRHVSPLYGVPRDHSDLGDMAAGTHPNGRTSTPAVATPVVPTPSTKK